MGHVDYVIVKLIVIITNWLYLAIINSSVVKSTLYVHTIIYISKKLNVI